MDNQNDQLLKRIIKEFDDFKKDFKTYRDKMDTQHNLINDKFIDINDRITKLKLSLVVIIALAGANLVGSNLDPIVKFLSVSLTNFAQWIASSGLLV